MQSLLSVHINTTRLEAALLALEWGCVMDCNRCDHRSYCILNTVDYFDKASWLMCALLAMFNLHVSYMVANLIKIISMICYELSTTIEYTRNRREALCQNGGCS